LTPQLFGEEVGGDGGQAREEGRQEDTDLSDVDGDVKRVENPVDDS